MLFRGLDEDLFCCGLLLFWLCTIFVVSGKRLFSLIGKTIELYPGYVDFTVAK